MTIPIWVFFVFCFLSGVGVGFLGVAFMNYWTWR
jgi:hypothetical protein